MSSTARGLAALIAAVGFAAVAVQFAVVMPDRPGLADPLARLWVLARYFTILTNLFTAGVMTAVALGRRPGPDLLATVTLGIVLVGAVYHTLLAIPVEGAEWWSDLGYHTLVPLGTAVWWLAWGGHGLRLRHLWRWLVWPAGFCVYALVRGQADGIYPYFFLDVGIYGWAKVILHIAGLLVAFGLAALVMWGHARVTGRAATD